VKETILEHLDRIEKEQDVLLELEVLRNA